ncbi:ABC-2 transporter permease [Paenibacillus algorifonticola]|uniref:ABC-2 transporter permease n=1 Tax=Paenibacillus algorifonticola TaxID=684063 RepID=UPI003D2AE8D3
MLLLLRKDLFILRYYFLYVLLYLYLFGFIMYNQASFILVAALSAIMLMTFSASLDAKNKSMIVIASLPVSSKSIVQAKYAAVLLFALIGIVASASVYAINITIVGREMVYAASFIPIIFFIIAVYASLYYPIYYRFGFSASRIVGLVAVALPVTFLMALGGVSSSSDSLSFPAAVSAVLLAVGCLLLIVSYRLSLFFLDKKGVA